MSTPTTPTTPVTPGTTARPVTPSPVPVAAAVAPTTPIAATNPPVTHPAAAPAVPAPSAPAAPISRQANLTPGAPNHFSVTLARYQAELTRVITNLRTSSVGTKSVVTDLSNLRAEMARDASDAV